MKKILIFILLLTFNFQLVTYGYLFGIKSFDNTITNIQSIESKYEFDFPIVAFIFDPWSNKVSQTLNNLNNTLGKHKIYHISISPNQYSAREVNQWMFDKQYTEFFELIKKNDLKVIFRTMHEMNGGRYPRASDPDNFKKARIHIRELSRKLWLDQKNILFDMSVNHRDMPSKWKPSQTAILTQCTPKDKYTEIEHKKFKWTWYKTEYIENKVEIPQSKRDKIRWKEIKYKTVWQSIQIPYSIYDTYTEKKKNCHTFEDYYPWDKYVDVMWVTFYNRWKASYNRHWYYPNKIINDPTRNTLERLRKFNKPIFIDEVATTSVRYEDKYSQQKSQESYQNNTEMKNKRLSYLKDFMIENPDILGMVYFNIDYTYWLTQRLIWEADRAIINLNQNKFYTWTYDLYNHQDRKNKLYDLFKTLSPNQKQDLSTSLTERGVGEISNISQILATKLKKKFWTEESIRRLDIILNSTNKTKVINIISETIKILEN